MDKVRVLINNHPLASFVVVAYGFSWGIWGLMIASTGHINWIGSFGPTVAALIVVAISQGRAGLGKLLRPIRAWRFGIGWYFFIFVGCILVFLIGLWGYLMLGGTVVLSSNAIVNQLVVIPIYFLIILIIGGSLGEEIGWRGYVLPHLLKQKNGLVSSGVVFAIWFAWHLPLFWLPGASQYGSPIGPYLLFIAVWSVLFTWVYLGTSGSLLAALLLHTSINTFSNFMTGVDKVNAEGPFLAYGIAFAILAVIVVATSKRMLQLPEENVRQSVHPTEALAGREPTV